MFTPTLNGSVFEAFILTRRICGQCMQSTATSLKFKWAPTSYASAEGIISSPEHIKPKKHRAAAAQSIRPSNSLYLLVHTSLSLTKWKGVMGRCVILRGPLDCMACSSLAMLLMWGSPNPSAMWRCLIAARYDFIVLWHKEWIMAREDTNWFSEAGRGRKPFSLQNWRYCFFLLSCRSSGWRMLGRCENSTPQLCPVWFGQNQNVEQGLRNWCSYLVGLRV